MPRIRILHSLAFAVLATTALPDKAVGSGGLNQSGNDWVAVGGDLSNSRNSPLSRINVANVARLGGAWLTELDAPTRTPPVVSNGTLYISDATSIYALDLANGSIKWRYVPKSSTPARGGVAIGQGMVFSGLSDSHIIAIDQNSGALKWTGYIGNAPPAIANAGPRINFSGGLPDFSPQIGFIANAPTYVNGTVMSGLTGGDGGVRGKISGLDATTGRLLWDFYVIPSAGAAGSETWPKDGAALQRGGGAVWTVGAADPDLGLVYYGTGNAVPQAGGEVRSGDNLYTASVVALDIKTGQLRWHYQLAHHDIWEMDAATPIVLFSDRMHGRERKALAAMRTDGYLFILDRESGKPLFPVEERPVKQDIRLRTAPTQPFPVAADKLGPACTDPETIPPGYRPACFFDPIYYDQPDIAPPLIITRQAPMSYDPATGFIYVTGMVASYGFRRFENPYVFEATHPEGAREYGIYAAINSKTNRIVWQNRSTWGLATGSGALSTAGGLLFHMEGDGTFQANDARTGKLLWQFQTGFLGPPGPNNSASSVPAASYEFRGEQYVAVPMGKAVWAFKLGGQLPPRKPLPPPSPVFTFAGAMLPLSDNAGQITIAGTQSGPGYGQEQYADEYAVTPQRARIKAGGQIHWTNFGVQSHNMIATDGTWTTGAIQPAQSVTMAISVPGTYEYYCKEHPWTRGQLRVEPSESLNPDPDTKAGSVLFMSEQATRGASSFKASCTNGCHLADLGPGERAPALAGATFLQRWEGTTVDALLRRIVTTMPQQNPHSLDEKVYLDIVAFLLRSNGYSPGQSELTPDSAKNSVVGQSTQAR